MLSPAWSTSVMPCRSSVNCTPVAFDRRRGRRVVGDGDGRGDDLARIDHAVTVGVAGQHGGLIGGEGLVGHVGTSYEETSTRSAGVATATHSTPAAAAASGN